MKRYEFGNAELSGIRKRLKVGAVVTAIGDGDGDGLAAKRLMISGLIELERGQVFENLLAVNGIEMHRDGVE